MRALPVQHGLGFASGAGFGAARPWTAIGAVDDDEIVAGLQRLALVGAMPMPKRAWPSNSPRNTFR